MTVYVQCAVCKMGVPWNEQLEKNFQKQYRGRFPVGQTMDQARTLCDRCWKEMRDAVNARDV